MARTIAVSGKGGVGKTTISALIIRHLKEFAEGPVLALDADPDANLATLLGLASGTSIGDLREETLAEMKNLPAGMSKAAYIESGLNQVIVESEKIDLMTMGRPEGPGCYCYINNLLRKFSDVLMSSYEWIVMDNEAGLEHLSRRTAARIDHLLVVVNDNPLSLDCADRINKLVAEIKNPIGAMGIIINGVRDDRVAAVRERAQALGIEELGCIPLDPELEDHLFDGRAIFESRQGPAATAVAEIMGRIGETKCN